MAYVTMPVLGEVTCMDPEYGSVPAHPSPPLPPVAVHTSEDAALHVRAMGVFTVAVTALADIVVGDGGTTVTCVDALTADVPEPQVMAYVNVPVAFSITGIVPLGPTLLPPQLTASGTAAEHGAADELQLS
jgi:hypothetical protein